jgi:sugar phosphate isomerase/epimerase
MLRYPTCAVLAALSAAVSPATLDEASAAGPACQSAPCDAPMLGCRLVNYGKFLEDGWSHLPSIGVHYVFLAVPPLGEVDAVKKKLAAHDLKVIVVRGEADLTKPDAYQGLAPQLEAARQLGARYMFLSPKHPGATKEEACQRLRKAGELAKKYGMTLVLETHPDLGTNADEHLQTMKRINHPNVRVNFDTGNITFYNKGLSAVNELKKVLAAKDERDVPYLAAVEIKDHGGGHMTWNFPTLGRGVVDIPGILRLLQEHGYCGPITMEIEGTTGVERSREQIKEEIAESAKYLHALEKFR